MFPTSVNEVLGEITSLKDRNPHLTSEMNDRIQTLLMELGFLKFFIWSLPSRSRKNLYIRATVGNGKLGLYGDRDRDRARSLDLAATRLLQKVELCKPKIRQDCLHLLDLSSQRKLSSSYELLQFINCTLSNLSNLVCLKVGSVVSMRMQARDLIKKLRMFKIFVKSTGEQWIFRINIQDCVYKTAYLSTLYWVDQMDEVMAARMKGIISDLLQMLKPYSPKIIGAYIRVLRASKALPLNNFEMGDVVASFVDSILPSGSMNLLHLELIFLVSFVMDPLPPNRVTNAKDRDLFLAKEKAEAIGSEIIPSLICSLTVGGMNQGTAEERNALLGDFREKTNKVKEEVRKFYVQNADSSRPRFPINNTLGFLDLLLENFWNLKGNYTTFTVHILVRLQKELVSLRPFLKKVKELQIQLEELKDLWMRINDAVYQAETVIDSFQIPEVPLWYNVICLSDLIEEMKFIKREIREIMQKQTWNKGVLNAEVTSGNIHLNHANTFRPDEVVVGFEDEEKEIISRLTRGSKKLDIVSIVGMPGQGKTTLAKKVYNSPSVRCHFHIYGWCFVSQVFEEKLLLLDILKGITTTLDDEFHNMSKEDVGQILYRCLKGRRYLIIMDDIWDITAWNALSESFPDDNNGSRILFTSRNKLGCNPLLLRPLSEQESMELLKHKLFFKDRWPPNFSYDVQMILNICKGLPLAVVVIAGLLNKVSHNMDLWRHTVRNIDSKVASEGCMDVLELSYKHLPDFLKPCFLYTGAVGQGKVFKVNKLIQLWIAEGFVRKSGIKSLEDVAREYLEGLIERSLVIANKRNFASGEVKECRIHDLLHELCLRKAEEERFMHFSEVLSFPLKPINFEHYRLCIHGRKDDNARPKSIIPIVRSLLIQSDEYIDDELYVCFYSSLKLVRVLDLGNLRFYNYFPEEVVSLIFLRYLAINCNVKVIPSSIGNLCNLESFHVATGRRIRLPQTIWKMKALRNMAIVGKGAFWFIDCVANMCAQLDNLDSFSSLYVSNLEEAEKLLRGFSNVRKMKLEISEENRECRRNCDLLKVFRSLRRLESLSLRFCWNATHTCAFNFPSALKKLTLSSSDCPWSQISTIGKLPNLEVLKFQKDAIGKGTWYVEMWHVGNEEFLKLKYLKLSGLSISYWKSLDNSFPCLERLVVRGCPFLVELPSIFVDVLTLKVIEIHRCCRSLATLAESIVNEQKDNGNEDLEVLISNVLEDKEQVSRLVKPYEWVFLDDLKARSEARWVPNARRTNLNVGEHLEWDKKGVLRSVTGFRKKCVANVRRTNLIEKHNCQPRQAIVSRHVKEELKRDG